MVALAINGTKSSGQDVRSANVTAVLAIFNIIKTSLGPLGLDKMLVDEIGEITITNDGATILKTLEVEHPAAKVLVELSQLQDAEVGDGTTSVVLMAAELLKRGNELVKEKIHPTVVISGYRTAMKEAIKYVSQNISLKLTDENRTELARAVINTTLSSKLIGSDGAFFVDMVLDAITSVKIIGRDGKPKYPIKSVSLVKTLGQSTQESQLVKNGYAIAMARSSQGMPMQIQNAKVACLDFALHKFRMPMSVEVNVKSPAELELIRQKELDITKDKINKILKAGATVIFTSKGIDDLASKYLVEAGVMGIRRVDPKDLNLIAKCTGAQVQISMGDDDSGEEMFDPAWLGTAGEVAERKLGDNDFIFVEGCEGAKSTTIVLRGANEFMLDEMERSVHDAICAVSRTLQSNSVVPAGGAVETAVALHLEDFALSLGTKDQLAVLEFAHALQMIPKQLAYNAAQDSAELLAMLRTAHTKAKESGDKEAHWTGLDLVTGSLRNAIKDGVVEATVSKVKSFKFAAEAAITILRIDDSIQLNPEQDPNAPM